MQQHLYQQHASMLSHTHNNSLLAFIFFLLLMKIQYLCSDTYIVIYFDYTNKFIADDKN